MLSRFLTQPKRVPSKVFNYVDNTMARFTLQRSAQAHYAPTIEQSLREVEAKSQAKFGGWSLSKSAIYTLCRHLLAKTTTPVLIELGGRAIHLILGCLCQKCQLTVARDHL